MSDTLKIADQSFTSRLILGTAGYPNQQVIPAERLRAAVAPAAGVSK